MKGLNGEPAISTVKVRGNIIYLPNWLRSYLGISDANKLEVYYTGNPGEVLLRRQSIDKIIKEQERKAASSYMNQAIRAAAKKDQKELDRLKKELDRKQEEIKKLKEKE